MRKQPQRQFSFTAGQLDPYMIARADIEHYLKGALELTNVVCLPTGGVTLRGGLVQDFEITDGGNGIRLGSFEVSPDEGLLIVATQKKLRIFNKESKLKEIATEYLGKDLRSLDFNQKMDTMIITSKNYAFKELIRQGNNTSWDFSTIELVKNPKTTFNNTTGGKNDIQQIVFKSFSNGNTIRISLDGAKTKSVVFSSSPTVTATNIRDAINGLETVDKENGGCTCVVINDNTYQIEFVGNDGKQDKPDVICAIEDQSSTAAQIVVKCIQEGEPPLENLWSTTRGYPYSSCHYQGRLFFGGSYAIPYQVNGSMTNNPYTFKTTKDNLDDEAVEIPADTDGACEIRRVYPMERLFLLTNKGVFAIKDIPIKPGASSEKQSDVPAAPVRPKEIDSAMIYITQNSEGVNQTVASLTYTYENEKYKSDDLAYLAPSVMRQPVAMDVRRSIKRNHATYLFVVNSDGTLAVLNSKQSQGLNGWSLCSTPYGKFLDAVVINDVSYFAIERTINGQKRYFIEHWDDNARLDMGIVLESETAKKSWTSDSLAVFEGLTVGVYADNLPYGEVVVNQKTIELDFDVQKIEVGLPFDWVVETMPAVVEVDDATLVGHSYRVPYVSVRFADTAGAFINGRQVCNRYFGRDSWDKENVLINGVKSIYQTGWFNDSKGKEATVRISGTSLQPATILSASMEVIY